MYFRHRITFDFKVSYGLTYGLRTIAQEPYNHEILEAGREVAWTRANQANTIVFAAAIVPAK